ncbi:MAG TPA: hypothetical protein VFF48_06165 [Brevundimonas sp.]|nr:hypothetical protein [Brevundimonas sp.]
MTRPLTIPALTLGLLLSAPTVSAQALNFGQVDRNGDGVLSAAELLSVFGQAGRSVLRNDRDGVVSPGELTGRGGDDRDDRDGARDDDDDDRDDSPRSSRGRGDDDRDDGPRSSGEGGDNDDYDDDDRDDDENDRDDDDDDRGDDDDD